MIRSRAGRFRVRRSGSSLHHWHRGPGPTTELSSQTVADLEPDGPIFESDGAGANKPHTLRTWSGAGPTTELSSQNVDVRSRAGRQVRVERSGAHLHHRGPGLQLDPRLSYQARPWSRTGPVRVGRSGSQQAPHAADLVRSRTHY